MSERVPAQNKTSATSPQATQASSPLLHQNPFTSGLSESLGDDSNISKELGGIQSKTIHRSLNWQNISVEAPSRSGGRFLPGGIQLQQEEPSAVSGETVSADSAQKSALESSNSTISTDESAQKPLIARASFNRRNIPVEAPPRSSTSNTYVGGIQRLETSGVKEQEESKQEQAKELVQTKLTVGAPGDKYEQEADSMAAKVMTMPDSVLQQPIQRQTKEETEAVQMQPLVNSITPLVQRSLEEKVSEPFPGEDVGLRPTNFGFKPRTVDINDPKLLEDADKLVGEVYKYFDSTMSTISKRKRGPVLAGVMHRAKGIIDFDINQIKPFKETVPALHPLMQERLNKYLEEARVTQLGAEALGKELPGIHAEVKAASKVLYTLEEVLGRPAAAADLDDLLIFNIRIVGPKEGQSIIRCPNCQVLTRDILSISDIPDDLLKKLSNYRDLLNSP
jgi:hypothetical protein